MQQLILMFHVLIAVAIIVLVLLQQGKGAEMGAAFGSGASQTLFGSRGSGSFLLKLTGVFALLFFVTSLVLGYMAAQQAKQDPLQALSKMAPPKTSAPLVPVSTLPVQNPIPTAPNPVGTTPPDQQ
jgi:preprotein translocase subunit SecG